jgi:hypothetical protein
MGNTQSTAVDGGAPEAPGILGKVGAIPRAQAITEGRKRRSTIKLPPKAVKSSPDDWPFIEVCSAGWCL